jgi:hypothetical protein
MDEQQPREVDAEPRVMQAYQDRSTEAVDDLTKRREQQRRALTDRERAERWPCG